MFRHMNIERFNEIEKEVVMLVESTIISVKEKSFEEYVLLLIHADFYEFIDSHRSCGLSPYVIEDPSDEYMDITRQKFLAQYLNKYSLNLQKESISDIDSIENEMNIQMMMYAHTWESHLFLKELERIASILSGKGYKWKSSVYNTRKSNFIKQNIIQPFQKIQLPITKCIEFCYNDELRNNFAHSTYYIDIESERIYFNNKGFMWGNSILINEWEEKFVQSILLSYHLPKCLRFHEDHFIENYGIIPIKLKRPLIANSQKSQEFYVVPEYDKAYDNKRVRFNFVRTHE